ncbi:CAAD domain-containing protein [Synechococcus sp. CCY 9618]|uniref:CAAD domain-containing protein n=1 Tax=Synechococcus sp. CCY 9618 TaxID=2815602 RepID=UPI001C2191B7|nr:CAAD domain-containing protein [Synechococcus sp. CCY 9618]
MAETPFFSPEPPSGPEHEEIGTSPQPTPTSPEGAIPAPPEPVAETLAEPGSEGQPSAPEPFSEPVSEPEPSPVASPEPGFAATLDVPALEDASAPPAEGGGEFELLLEKLRDWFGSGELQAQWQRFRGPLKGLAILIGVVLLLRVYAALIGTLDSLPLVGGLLELAGLIAVTRFSLTRLVRKSDREEVFADWSRRWKDFRGKD